VLEALDQTYAATGIRAVGNSSSAVTIPAQRNAAQSHDLVLGLAFSDAVSSHVIELEG
jgi:hypothetical protein